MMHIQNMKALNLCYYRENPDKVASRLNYMYWPILMHTSLPLPESVYIILPFIVVKILFSFYLKLP